MQRSKSQTSIKSSLTLAAVLGCSALVVPALAQAATAAKTSWAVSRVASISQGSYCTMAQKYDDATVLTLAKNTKGEYSLAVDFQEARFKDGEKQKVSLRAQGGAAQTYSVTPQSDKTAVIGIGKDESLVKQLASGEVLSIEISGKTFDYALSQFAAGQSEMGNCIEALAGSKDKAAELASSAKTGVSSPDAQVKRQVAVVKSPEMNAAAADSVSGPSVEGLLAAKPTPSEMVAAVSSEATEVIPVAPKVETKASKAKSEPVIVAAKDDTKTMGEISNLKEENARLSRAMDDQRQALQAQNQQSSGQEAAVAELRQKLADQQAQNEKLKTDLSAQSSVAAKDKVKSQATSQTTQQTLEALQAENATLKNQIQIYAKNAAAQPAVAAAAVAESDDKLHLEIRALRTQIEQAQTEKLALQDQLEKARQASDSKQMKVADGNWDLEQATRRYQESQREIQRLGVMLQTKDAQCTTEKKEIEAKLFDPAIAKSSQVAMLNSLEDQVSEKDGKIKALETELASTKSQIQAAPEKDQKIVDLEKQLVASKTDMAKKLDEANAAQTALIASLKSELAAKDKQILMASQSKSSEVEQAKSAVEAQEKAMAALKAELAQKAQQVAELQAKADVAEKSQAAAADKDKTLTALQSELAQKTQQMTELQAKVAAAEKSQVALADKDKTLAALQAELTQKNQLLADAQAKSQQAVQTQAVASAAQDSTIGTLKAQVAQLQAQLASEQTRSQQIDAKASAEQATTLATLQMQVQQGNQKISELQGQINGMKAAAVAPAAAPSMAATLAAAAPVAAAVAPASYAAPTSVVPTPVAPAALPTAVPSVKFISMDDFSSMLRSSGVPVKGALEQVQGGDPSSYRAYSWKTDSLYGSVEMRRVSGTDGFESVIGQYLGRAKSRCSGEFAAVPSQVKAGSMEMSKSYEIACVSQSASSSASVLFAYGSGVAMTVAHEGRAEAMDLAMDARDRVAGQLR